MKAALGRILEAVVIAVLTKLITDRMEKDNDQTD